MPGALRYTFEVHTILLVTGPPVSAHLWVDVVARLENLGQPVQTVELFDPVPKDSSIHGLSNRLEEIIHAVDGDVVLVAHGSAIPVAWTAATRVDLRGLVLTNGPLASLDPFLATFCRLARNPRLLASTLLRPALLQRWLASSAGLRRTVVNPYVMDRDMVVAVSRPYLQTLEARLAVAEFLKDLPKTVANLPELDLPTLMLWGDEDRLYPPSSIDQVRHLLPQISHARISGGQHHHPAERPWEIADQLANWTPNPD